MILGLTGGMGGGKSTAARFFENAGFKRIDSDQVVKERLLPRADVVERIAARFPEVISEDGTVNRAALASRIFENEADLAWLEDWLHPLVYEVWRGELASDPNGRWVIEVPLLFEKRLENWFDFIVCVSTSSPNQLARLKERGIPHSLAGKRISKQLPLAQKIDLADFVLSNDGTPEALQAQVGHLAARLTKA